MPRAMPAQVYLTGFMGAGKSSVGKVLSERLGWRFVDLDERVSAAAGREIAAIFGSEGEEGFRRREEAELHRLLASPGEGPMVVALGGGTFTLPAVREVLRKNGGMVILLDAPPEELLRRCQSQPHAAERPLLRNAEAFRKLYQCRREAYRAADLRVETSGRTVQQVAAELAERIAGSPAQSEEGGPR